MKGKIKVKLEESGLGTYLTMYLKLEDECFYNTEKIILRNDIYKTNNNFYKDATKLLSDKNKLTEMGTEMIKEKLEKRAESASLMNDEKKVIELLKELKQPIEIEVKE